MAFPSQVDVDSFELNIHIAGSGFGEAIVITIGKRLLIGIDFCRPLLQKGPDKDTFLDGQIKSLRKDAYKLWILTHYHYDHFQSFYQLLSNYNDQLHSVIFPVEYTSLDFAYLASISISSKHRADEEYGQIKDFLDRKAKTNYSSYQSGSSNWVNSNLINKSGQERRLIIEIYAPPPAISKSLRSRNIKKVIAGQKKFSRDDANMSSYIVHLTFGTFEALFLADAPIKRSKNEAWGQINNKHGISLLKVAHHGSKNGTNQQLLDSLKGECVSIHKKVALVSPYDHFNLPEQKVLDLLKSENFIIFSSKETICDTDLARDIQIELSKLLIGFCVQKTDISINELISPSQCITSVKYDF